MFDFHNGPSEDHTMDQQSQKQTDVLSMQSQSDDDQTYNMRFMKKNKASFGKSNTMAKKVNEFEQKFQKQIELSQNDAMVIEQQQKKIVSQKLEVDELTKKVISLKKQYENFLSQMGHFQEKAEQYDKMKSQLEFQISKFQMDRERVAQERDRALKEGKSLSGLIEQLKRQLEEKNDTIMQLRTTNKHKATELNKKKGKLSRLSLNFTWSLLDCIMIFFYVDTITTQQHQISEQHHLISLQKDDIKELKEKLLVLSSSEDIINKLTQDNAQKTNLVAELKTRVSEFESYSTRRDAEC